MEDKKANSLLWPVVAVVVLVAALGLGMGIRKIRLWRAEPETKEQVKVEAEKGDAEIPAESIVVNAAEGERVEVSEPAEEVQAEAEEVVEEEEDSSDVSESQASGRGRTMMAGGMGNWQQMWGDLNLTPEETARIREGFRLAMERWQNMSEEERQVQMARFRGMREQWESMSDEERQETMQRMRGRFEDWRASGDVELPEMTLD